MTERKRIEGRSKWERHAPAIGAMRRDVKPEKAATKEAYRMASEIVRLLNATIDAETDPTAREHFKRALDEAHKGEDLIARALELERGDGKH